MTFKIGDTVAIRGDIRSHSDGGCVYFPHQLAEGKYLKNTATGEKWTGKIKAIDEKEKMALVGGGWRGFEFYELIEC